jgi:WD40 repeat protein
MCPIAVPLGPTQLVLAASPYQLNLYRMPLPIWPMHAGIGAGGSNRGSTDASLIFDPRPVKEFVGHGDDVFDLSWSNNNFLLTGSRDKSVKLWHVSTDAALKTFRYVLIVRNTNNGQVTSH